MAMKLAEAFVELHLDDQKLRSGIDGLSGVLDSLGNAFDRTVEQAERLNAIVERGISVSRDNSAEDFGAASAVGLTGGMGQPDNFPSKESAALGGLADASAVATAVRPRPPIVEAETSDRNATAADSIDELRDPIIGSPIAPPVAAPGVTDVPVGGGRAEDAIRKLTDGISQVDSSRQGGADGAAKTAGDGASLPDLGMHVGKAIAGFADGLRSAAATAGRRDSAATSDSSSGTTSASGRGRTTASSATRREAIPAGERRAREGGSARGNTTRPASASSSTARRSEGELQSLVDAVSPESLRGKRDGAELHRVEQTLQRVEQISQATHDEVAALEGLTAVVSKG